AVLRDEREDLARPGAAERRMEGDPPAAHAAAARLARDVLGARAPGGDAERALRVGTTLDERHALTGDRRPRVAERAIATLAADACDNRRGRCDLSAVQPADDRRRPVERLDGPATGRGGDDHDLGRV